MFKKFVGTGVLVIVLAAVSGCAVILAGAAGGAGTAVWLSGKLTLEAKASFDKSIKASRSGLKALDMPIEKETVTKSVAQIIAKHNDGRKVWVDIHKITNTSSRIEVRVGATGDKAAAQKVMDKIQRYL